MKHQLVESVRINSIKTQQRVVMNLGLLDLPRREWKKLAHALECQLSGQISLLEDHDSYIDDLALSLVSNNKLSEKLNISESFDTRSDEKDLISINLNTVSVEKTRNIGSEIVCQGVWDLLKFDNILTDCGFSQNQKAIAKTLIFGRLISPGSELHTIRWFRKHSALSEFPGVDVSNCGKDQFYEVGDKLYENKDKLEDFLFQRQQELFPINDDSIFLYDLTNTYMEGSCLANDLAEYGHCKSKRFDCPLITLSMLIRNDGTPVASHIYKGNQSEPETMADMISRIETMFAFDSPQMVLEKPTIIMDRGIATDINIRILESKSYPYIIISRADHCEQYFSEFETARNSFTRIDDLNHKRSVYGENNYVYVKKLDSQDEKTCKILCLSDGKARKENAIAVKKDKRYLTDIEKLNLSIHKGSIKNIEKIQNRLEKTKKRHKKSSENYNVKIIINDAGKAQGIEITSKFNEPNPLAGCYIIESTHIELSDMEIWKLYMTQTHVENAFRSMKNELGMRPVYHQNKKRSSAHLFITVLAYHILSAIERRLAQYDDTRCWQTLRDVLSTHTRNTVIMKDKDDNIYHYRISGKPEDAHQDIYKKLNIKDPTTTFISRFK